MKPDAKALAVEALEPFARFDQWMHALNKSHAIRLKVNGDYFIEHLTVQNFTDARVAVQALQTPAPQPEELREAVARIIKERFLGWYDSALSAAQSHWIGNATADILALLPSYRPPEGYVVDWRPIESAPRDGTHIILAFGQDHSSEGWFVDRDDESRPWAFIDIGDYNVVIINKCRDDQYGPSHWQPMPFREPRHRAAPPSPSPEAPGEG